MNTAHLVSLATKMLCQGDFERRHQITMLSMRLQIRLLGEYRANGNKFVVATLRVQTAVPYVAKQHIGASLWPHVEVLADASEG